MLYYCYLIGLKTYWYNSKIEPMEKEQEKEESFGNDELNMAFVEGELNKTVTNNNEATEWNLLDDPQMMKEEEEVDNFNENFLEDEEK